MERDRITPKVGALHWNNRKQLRLKREEEERRKEQRFTETYGDRKMKPPTPTKEQVYGKRVREGGGGRYDDEFMNKYAIEDQLLLYAELGQDTKVKGTWKRKCHLENMQIKKLVELGGLDQDTHKFEFRMILTEAIGHFTNSQKEWTYEGVYNVNTRSFEKYEKVDYTCY